jgi:HEAT repeat protein
MADLRRFLESETDPTVRFYLQLIVGPGEESGRAVGETESELIAELEKCLEGESPDFLHFFLRVKWVPREQMPLVIELFRRMQWSEFPEEVLPFFLKLVRDFGSPSEVPVLEELCRHRNPHVISLAVDALARHGPDRIESMLVPLLLNPNPGIRFQAIRNLSKRDPDEAFRHYEGMLFSRDPAEKLVALFHAYFFPFEKIEDAMLKFISFEQDPFLISRAGHLFIINPSPESPLRLVDLLEHSTGPKMEELKRIILEVIRFLERSGEISQTAPQFLEELKKTYSRKRALQAINRCGKVLSSDRVEDRLKAVEKLLELQSRGYQEAAGVLEGASRIESDPVILARLEEWNHVPTQQERPSGQSAESSFHDCLERIRQMTPDEYRREQSGIISLYQGVTNDQKAVLLRFIISFEGDEALPFLRTCLESSIPEVLAVAIELVGGFPEPGIFEKASALIAHDDARVRAAAFRTLTLLDKGRAIDLCRQWLLSSQACRRLEGIHIVANLDFPAIRGALLECLAVERDPDNLASIFSVLTPHLDVSLVQEVARLLRGFPDLLRATVEEALVSALDASPMSSLSSVAKHQLLDQAKDACHQEQQTPAAPLAWSFEEVQKRRLSQSPLSEPPREEAGEPGAGSPVQGSPADGEEIDSLAVSLELLRENPDRWGEKEIIQAQSRLEAVCDRTAALRLRVLLLRARHRAELPKLKMGLVDEFERLLSSSPKDFEAIAFALDLVTTRESALIVPLLRTMALEPLPEEFLPFLVITLKRFGGPQDSSLLETLCRNSDPRVTYLAVEALEKVNPEDLKPLLVHLLAHDHPLIRSRAIRLLSLWDPPEARKHFAGALFSEDVGERKAALNHAFYLPFPGIEPLLMRFLAFESDPRLLRLAGNIIRANASPEIPHHLVEIAERAAGPRLDLIKLLIEDVVRSIFKAGLETGDPPDYIDRLKAQARQRRALTLLEQLKPTLLTADREARAQAVSQIHWLGKSGVPEAVEILRGQLPRETDPDLKQEIALGLPALEASTLTQTPAPEIGGDRLAWLSGLTKEHFSVDRTTVHELLENGLPREKRLALRCLAELGDKTDAPRVRKCLGDSISDVVVAAIETLSILDRTALDQVLLPLLDHPDVEVRAAVAVFLADFKPRQALGSLEMILGHLKPATRAVGIRAAGRINFAIIRDLLWASFEREPLPENRGQIAHILLPNIDEELFFRIFGMQETVEGNVSLMAPKTQPASRDELNELLHLAARRLLGQPKCRFESIEELFASAREKWQEEEKKKQKVPSYAYSNVKKIRGQKEKLPLPAASQKTGISWFLETLGKATQASAGRFQHFLASHPRMAPIAAAVILVGILIGGWLFGSGSSRTENPDDPRQPVSPLANRFARVEGDPIIVGQQRDIRGLIENVYQDGILIKLETTETPFMIRMTKVPDEYYPGRGFAGRVRVDQRLRTRYVARLQEGTGHLLSTPEQ